MRALYDFFNFCYSFDADRQQVSGSGGEKNHGNPTSGRADPIEVQKKILMYVAEYFYACSLDYSAKFYKGENAETRNKIPSGGGRPEDCCDGCDDR